MEVYLPQALFVLLLICFFFQLYYLVFRHRLLASYKVPHTIPQPSVPVSIIISARNEFDNLTQYLPVILDQDYPDYEVIVVNDCSYDKSEFILEQYEKQYTRLKVVNVYEHDRFKTGKKFALTLGIKAAKNEHLLFTDADCEPASRNWLIYMAANFTGEKQLVLGYSPYRKERGFVNLFTRFETLRTAINYLSAALKGDAYMGIGRNLAYTKTLFFKSKGFASHMHIMSGDDDLFVNENATPDNTVIEINPDAHTFTDSKKGFSGYSRQKSRHMGAGKLYKGRHRRYLSFDAITGILFYLLLAALFALKFQPWVVLSVYVLRLLLQVVIYSNLFKKLRCPDLLWWLPLFDVFYYIYLNLFGLTGTFSKTTTWK